MNLLQLYCENKDASKLPEFFVDYKYIVKKGVWELLDFFLWIANDKDIFQRIDDVRLQVPTLVSNRKTVARLVIISTDNSGVVRFCHTLCTDMSKHSGMI